MGTWACPQGRSASLSHSLAPSPVSLPTFYSHGRRGYVCSTEAQHSGKDVTEAGPPRTPRWGVVVFVLPGPLHSVLEPWWGRRASWKRGEGQWLPALVRTLWLSKPSRNLSGCAGVVQCSSASPFPQHAPPKGPCSPTVTTS